MAVLLAGGVCAASVSAAPATPIAAPEAEERDADTMAALDAMGAALRKLQTFSVRAAFTDEDVLTTGQKIQSGGTVDIKVRRPDGFVIDTRTEHNSRTIFYDGKNLSLLAPALGLYGTMPAPATIAATIATASEDYGIELPLVDLISWGTDPALIARVTSAFTADRSGRIAARNMSCARKMSTGKSGCARAPIRCPARSSSRRA
ncbi:DUF2092 domain-containing protein [Sandarakinorhabdus glacialis]|nr:DUF2092 domain-containing protein [Polymorphobacter glacialis]